MYRRILGVVGAMAWLAVGAAMGAEKKVAVVVTPVEGGGEAELMSQIMQAELSQSSKIMLVEREQLNKMLKEMQLTAQELSKPSTAQKVGTVIGARYFCSGSVKKSGDKSLAIVKVVDVTTTLTKLAYAPFTEDDAVATGKSLAQQVEKLVGQFEQEQAKHVEVAATNAKALPEEWKRPTVMVIIPEMHVRSPDLIDPAAETEIVKRLLAEKFKVVDSEYVVMMKKGQKDAQRFRTLKTCTQYAESKKVDILLYGEAISERGASVGEFVGCRGRVELKAVNVRTDEILVSDSAEGGATDLAETVAGKKAIQQAANRLADTFLYAVAEKWNIK